MTTEITITAEAPESLNSIELSVKVAVVENDVAGAIGRAHAYVQELHKLGYKRKFVPSFASGFKGQQRQDDPIPDHLVRPEHCGQPMRYVKEKPANGDKKAVAAHWDCVKGRGCAEARTIGENRFPFTNWHLTPKQPGEASAPASNGTTEKPLDLGGFLTAAWKLGFSRSQVIVFARTNEDELKKMGAAEWADLLSKLRAENKQTTAGA